MVGLVISTFKKPRLKDCEFQTSLGYIAKPCLKNKQNNDKKLCFHD